MQVFEGAGSMSSGFRAGEKRPLTTKDSSPYLAKDLRGDKVPSTIPRV